MSNSFTSKHQRRSRSSGSPSSDFLTHITNQPVTSSSTAPTPITVRQTRPRPLSNDMGVEIMQNPSPSLSPPPPPPHDIERRLIEMVTGEPVPRRRRYERENTTTTTTTEQYGGGDGGGDGDDDDDSDNGLQSPSEHETTSTMISSSDTLSSSKKQQNQKYGIEYVDPKELKKYDPHEEFRDEILGRPPNAPNSGINHTCILCEYVKNRSQDMKSVGKNNIYPPVQETTFQFIYAQCRDALKINQLAIHCGMICDFWEKDVREALNADFPKHKPLPPLKPYQLFDHFTVKQSTGEIQELVLRNYLLDQQYYIQQNGIVKQHKKDKTIFIDHTAIRAYGDLRNIRNKSSEFTNLL